MSIAPLLIQGGLAAAGSILGRKKSKSPDLSPLIDSLNASGERQKQTITGLRPKLQPLGQRLRDDTTAAGARFEQRFGDASGELAQKATDFTRSNVLAARPELEQSTREALAGSGLNRGGALVSAIAKQNQTYGQQIGQASREAGLQNLQDKKTAMQTTLGLDTGVIDKLFASGREDLIREAELLIQEEQNRTNTLAGVMGQQITNNTAADLANGNRRGDLLNTLLGTAGQVAGQYYQGKRQDDLLKRLGY